MAQMYSIVGLSRWLSGKESTYQAGDISSIPGSGRSPEEANGNPHQYPCLGRRSLMDCNPQDGKGSDAN